MKTLTLLFLLIISFQTLSAQGKFSISVDSSFQEYQGVDLNQNNLLYRFDADIKNIGDSTMNIGWSAFDILNCPSEWNLVVSDKYLEYILDSNFDYAIATDLIPEEVAPYNVIFNPRDVPGCCSIKVQFYNADNPSEVFDTSYYQLKLNVENCTLTKTSEIGNNVDVQLYPNPTTDIIAIETSKTIISGEIYSIDGIKMMSIELKQNTIDVSELNAGKYFLNLNFSKNRNSILDFVKQ